MSEKLKQILVIAGSIILAIILLPIVAGIFALVIRIGLFVAIVAAIYWAYNNYIRK